MLITGIVNLIASETFAASFPLHDGPYYKDGHSLAEDGPLNDRHVSRFKLNNIFSLCNYSNLKKGGKTWEKNFKQYYNICWHKSKH